MSREDGDNDDCVKRDKWPNNEDDLGLVDGGVFLDSSNLLKMIEVLA